MVNLKAHVCLDKEAVCQLPIRVWHMPKRNKYAHVALMMQEKTFNTEMQQISFYINIYQKYNMYTFSELFDTFTDW